MAHAFVEHGARVAVVDLRREPAERVANALGSGRAVAIEADVSSGAAVRAAVAKTKQTFGIPHIVVNNAGFTHRNRPLLEVDEATFDKTFAVNVKSIYHMVSAAAEIGRASCRER